MIYGLEKYVGITGSTWKYWKRNIKRIFKYIFLIFRFLDILFLLHLQKHTALFNVRNVASIHCSNLKKIIIIIFKNYYY